MTQASINWQICQIVCLFSFQGAKFRLSINLISDEFGKTFRVVTGYKTSGIASYYYVDYATSTFRPDKITKFGFESIHPRSILTELVQGFNYYVLGAITPEQYVARTRGIYKAGPTGRQNLPLDRPYDLTDHSVVNGVYDDLPILRGLRSALGFGIDFGIGAGFQYLDDMNNPYLTGKQKVGRSLVSGTGGATTAIGLGIVVGCGASVVCGVTAGVIGGIIWTVWGQPFVFEQLGDSVAPHRNLKALGIGN
ncbi:MAG: hypothetical protein GY943_04705 [Chloroflexi bacterium]|nr:hypothetical protein [Chloroflexota bacterium]